VFEFLITEGEKLTCIHKHLLKVYGEAMLDMSTVHCWAQWTNKVEQGAKLRGSSRNGSPCTAVMPANIHYVDEMIRGESCTTDELCCALSTSKQSVMAIAEELGYSKVCAW
jgi:hypothetical protein